MVSPFRGKAVENALVAVLRDLKVHPATLTLKSARPYVAERIDGCSAPELAAAVQSLRYAGKLKWNALELADSMKIETAAPHHGAAAEGPEAGDDPATSSTPVSGPDDEDDEDYPGGVNDCTEAIEKRREEDEPVSGEGAPGAVPIPVRPPEPAVPVGRVEEPRPDEQEHQRAGARPGLKTPGGWTKAANAAGARPVPAPQHESEVERVIREEANETVQRRRLARSTGTVRQPIELRRLGIPDLSLGEAVTSLLAETPHDLLVAVNRKHPALWRRVILLGRARGEGPAKALYAAIERGLEALEAANIDDQADAA